ncbi:helix-turn-helix domain-containing protein [Thermus brockianus]|nr:helix-turn-helix transcriptional regulator [Thermus brockianus]
MIDIVDYRTMGRKRIRFRLREYLKERGLSVYKLVKLVPEMHPSTVYAIAAGRIESVRLSTLAQVLEGLERLTGEPVDLCALLRVEEVEGAETGR